MCIYYALGILLAAITTVHGECLKDILWLPIGDSLTAASGREGWRVPTASNLSQAGLCISTMGDQDSLGPAPWNRHAGHYGETPQELARRLPNLFSNASARKPDIISVLVGTNGCKKEKARAASARATKVTSYMIDLVNEIIAASPTSTIFIASSIPVGPQFTALGKAPIGFSECLFALPFKYKAAAKFMNETSGTSVYYVPLFEESGICRDMNYTSGKAWNCDSVDGVHPNRKGYEEMALVWTRYFKKALLGNAALGATPGRKLSLRGASRNTEI